MNPSNNQMDAALADMPVKVTGDMNSHLEAPFTEGEIMEALAQMCPTKAPSPDGFPAAFFQKHWNSVKKGLLTTCLHVLIEKEAFSNLLVQAEKNKVIYWLKLSNSISITHLLFADDSLVFTKASSEGCKNLKNIFYCYASASG